MDIIANIQCWYSTILCSTKAVPCLSLLLLVLQENLNQVNTGFSLQTSSESCYERLHLNNWVHVYGGISSETRAVVYL